MQRAGEAYAARGLVVVTVGVDAAPDATAAFLRERGIGLPVTPDPDGALQRQLGTFGHPSFVFVDRNSKVVGRAIGFRDWLSPAGRAFLEDFTRPGAP